MRQAAIAAYGACRVGSSESLDEMRQGQSAALMQLAVCRSRASALVGQRRHRYESIGPTLAPPQLGRESSFHCAPFDTHSTHGGVTERATTVTRLRHAPEQHVACCRWCSLCSFLAPHPSRLAVAGDPGAADPCIPPAPRALVASGFRVEWQRS